MTLITTVFLWHHVKEEIESELQMKKAEMISSKIRHVPVATVHYNSSKSVGQIKKENVRH